MTKLGGTKKRSDLQENTNKLNRLKMTSNFQIINDTDQIFYNKKDSKHDLFF